MYLYQTYLQQALEADIKDKINNIKTKQFASKTIDEVITNGAIVYKIPINKTSVVAAINNSATGLRRLSTEALHKAVTQKIIQIPDAMAFKDALSFIEKFRLTSPTTFYGAILQDRDNPEIFINPFHVITAATLLENPAYLTKAWKILIYFNPIEHSSFHAKVPKHIEKEFHLNIQALMQMHSNRLSTFKKLLRIDQSIYHNNPLLSKTSLQLQYQIKLHADEDKEFSSYIVPTQFVTKGIIAPFYATNLIQISNRGNRQTKGASISPFKTCNIGSGDSNTLEYTSVCTGSKSNRTIEGLQTLTHANLGSPYGTSKQGVPHHGNTYVNLMINYSQLLYNKAGLFNEYQPYTSNTSSDDSTDSNTDSDTDKSN